MKRVFLSSIVFLLYLNSRFNRLSLVYNTSRKKRIKKIDDKTYHLKEFVEASLKFVDIFFVQA